MQKTPNACAFCGPGKSAQNTRAGPLFNPRFSYSLSGQSTVKTKAFPSRRERPQIMPKRRPKHSLDGGRTLPRRPFYMQGMGGRGARQDIQEGSILTLSFHIMPRSCFHSGNGRGGKKSRPAVSSFAIKLTYMGPQRLFCSKLIVCCCVVLYVHIWRRIALHIALQAPTSLARNAREIREPIFPLSLPPSPSWLGV